MTPSPWTDQKGTQNRAVKSSTATKDNARAGLPTVEEMQEHEARQRMEAQRRANSQPSETGVSRIERILRGDEE